MIPILFDANAQDFSTNGLGRLTDCISCLVTEERNGIYEVEIEYPITGLHYESIEQGRVILVSHDEQQDKQPFVIYRISRPINGVVTINAHHISYKLSGVIIEPFEALSVTDAFNGFKTHALTDNPFTFWTDKASAGTFSVETPTSCKRLLGGTRGSILDAFGGGEYEWDGYTVKLYAHRGSDNGVTIRYGKNLTAINQTVDTMDLYNAVIPYWSDNESTVVYGGIVYGNGGISQQSVWTDENNTPINDENGSVFDFAFDVSQVAAMDLSEYFEDPPTVAELEARALTVINSNTPWIPHENIKIDFVSLWQTEEYKNIAPLERVQLCDTVSVYYPELGVNATAKVVSVVWDALADRYDSIELGDAQSSFANVLQAETDEKLKEVPNISMMEEAIQHATDLITGGMGGHIVFLYDADGKPTDMLVMDTEDVNTAIHVLRINVNGIGFSSTGPSGIFTSAWTLDGSFVADWITAGHLSANRIQGGTLTLGGNNNGNGVLVVYNSSGDEIGRWNNTGITQKRGHIYSYLGTAYDISYGLVDGHLSFDGTNGLSVNYDDDPTGKSSFNVLPYSSQLRVERYGLSSAYDITGVGNPIANTGTKSYVYRCTEPTQVYTDVFSHNASTLALERHFMCRASDGVTGFSDNSSFNMPSYGTHTYADMYVDPSNTRIFIRSGANKTASSCALLYIEGSGSQITHTGGEVLAITTGVIKLGTKTVQFAGSSSKRYKHGITDKISKELDAHKLYALPMKQFAFNDDFEKWQYNDMKGQTLPGFIAEDVAEIYPAAAIHDEDGNIESWDERRIIPGMLKLIQEQHDEIEDLKARLVKLEAVVEKLMR